MRAQVASAVAAEQARAALAQNEGGLKTLHDELTELRDANGGDGERKVRGSTERIVANGPLTCRVRCFVPPPPPGPRLDGAGRAAGARGRDQGAAGDYPPPRTPSDRSPLNRGGHGYSTRARARSLLLHALAHARARSPPPPPSTPTRTHAPSAPFVGCLAWKAENLKLKGREGFAPELNDKKLDGKDTDALEKELQRMKKENMELKMKVVMPPSHRLRCGAHALAFPSRMAL